MDLLKADPESVLFHGDPAALPTKHRRELLKAVGRADPWFLSASRDSTALAGLAGDDLAEASRPSLSVPANPSSIAQRHLLPEGIATASGPPGGMRRLAVDACVRWAVSPTLVRRRVLIAISEEPAGRPAMPRLHLLSPLVGQDV